MYHDILGMMQHPHYVKVTPKFCKQYASVGTVRSAHLLVGSGASFPPVTCGQRAPVLGVHPPQEVHRQKFAARRS